MLAFFVLQIIDSKWCAGLRGHTDFQQTATLIEHGDAM